MTSPDGERIARVEQQIIDLKSDVAEVKSDTKYIKDMLGETFVKRTEVEKWITDTKQDFINEIKQLRKKRWYENTLSAAMGVTLTLVIQQFFQKLFLSK